MTYEEEEICRYRMPLLTPGRATRKVRVVGVRWISIRGFGRQNIFQNGERPSEDCIPQYRRRDPLIKWRKTALQRTEKVENEFHNQKKPNTRRCPPERYENLRERLYGKQGTSENICHAVRSALSPVAQE